MRCTSSSASVSAVRWARNLARNPDNIAATNASAGSMIEIIRTFARSRCRSASSSPGGPAPARLACNAMTVPSRLASANAVSAAILRQPSENAPKVKISSSGNNVMLRTGPQMK